MYNNKLDIVVVGRKFVINKTFYLFGAHAIMMNLFFCFIIFFTAAPR